MRRTKRRGNALFRKVKQLYSTIVRKKIKGYSKNHKIFSKNETSQGRKGLGRGKNAIDSARAAGANAATRRAKSDKLRKSAPVPKPGRPEAVSYYSARAAGANAATRRAKSGRKAGKPRKSAPVPKTGRPEAASYYSARAAGLCRASFAPSGACEPAA